MDNTTKRYWKQYPEIIKRLSHLTGRRKSVVRWSLAYIAGDRHAMPDAEVIETFLNEQK